MYDRVHIRCVIGGRLGTGLGFDEWQITMNFANTDPDEQLPYPTSTLAGQIFGAYSTLHRSSEASLSQWAYANYCKLALVDEEGHYLGEAAIHETTVTVAGSVTAATGASPQDSTVVSWWSGGNLGDANHGRIYLPWSAQPIVQDGRFAGNGALAEEAGQFVEAANTLMSTFAGAPTLLSIMSKKGTGTTKPVAFVRVGNVKDTQRRRRSALVEQYATEPVDI